MAGNNGSWHQTSEQPVRHRQQPRALSHGTTFTTATTFAAGLKRRLDEEKSADGRPVVPADFDSMPPPPPPPISSSSSSRRQQPPPGKRLVNPSLPPMPSRLQASAIIDVASSRPLSDAGPAQPTWLRKDASEYSQRRVLNATPTVAQDPLLSLAHPRYGLPAQIVTNLADMGIRSIYPWQKQCLLAGGADTAGGESELLDGTRNLVYAAPTGGGKSLVADVLMLRRVLDVGSDSDSNSNHIQSRPKALLVLPFVALVQEKVRWLRRVIQNVTMPTGAGPYTQNSSKNSLRVVGFFGGAKIRATWADFDIGVATIEKANALINTAVEDCTIGNLKVVVLDELHMIDDSHRGYLLELLATKLMCLEHAVQVVGMSATLANIDLLARWLGAFSYQTRYRPVPIEEHIVYDGCIYSAEATVHPQMGGDDTISASQEIKDIQLPLVAPLRRIQPGTHNLLLDSVTNAVVALANETARAGYGALVFSSSRAATESDALLISRVLSVTPEELGSAVWEARLDLLGELQALVSSSLDTHLSQTILAGVGFHHAGMTAEERDLVARAYDDGVLKVIVATCGLAAGINLPARRVILHNIRMGRELVGPAMLRQMRGRAGRKGKDELGETYLCCRSSDIDDVVDLMHAELPHVSSCLVTDSDSDDSGKDTVLALQESGNRRLQRALLEVIAVRLATSRESIDAYLCRTMLFHASLSSERDEHSGDLHGGHNIPASLASAVEASLEALQAHGFIERDTFDHFQPTRLGKAVVASALDPASALFIHGELARALRAFVLDGEMHVLYTFTPVHDGSTSSQIDWRRFWEEMEGLDESGLRVLRFLGLKPSVISSMQHGATLKETTAAEKATARIYRRFYLALQLRDLCNEMPVHRVAQKYSTPRGAVQTLAQTCEGFAAGMIKFCEHMGWGAMGSVLEHFVDRLKAGAKADLLALARIAFVKSRTARVFWENGFKTVAAVANADPNDLLPVLLQAQASKVRFGGDHNEAKFRAKLLEKAQIITDSANRIWQLEMQNDLDEE
ncbi:hypothetical protein SEPCBS57363_002346 [Sporothrix epigloea]|uniref:DNA polymerase theta subunit n=1 Tax=Sporothrix epigloea TaxID=1892477 RepID=A0ABP0DGK9_9PEZI